MIESSKSMAAAKSWKSAVEAGILQNILLMQIMII